jgi:hypothetical protein
MAAEYLMLKKGKANLEHCTKKRKNHKATTGSNAEAVQPS